jgi:hypothetical protein
MEMSNLALQVVEKNNVSQRWHFFSYHNVIKATIYKDNDKSYYEWKIINVGRKELIEKGICFSFDEAISKIENYLNNEMNAKDVY